MNKLRQFGGRWDVRVINFSNCSIVSINSLVSISFILDLRLTRVALLVPFALFGLFCYNGCCICAGMMRALV